MTIRVLLLVSNPEARQAYLEAVANIPDVACDVACDVAALRKALTQTGYHGLLMDLPTVIKAEGIDKPLLHTLQNIYPVARLRLDRRRGLLAYCIGQPHGSKTALADFFRSQCAAYRARPLRSGERITMHLGAAFHPEPDAPESAAERTTTLNVSTGGAFLYTTSRWKRGDVLWIRVTELSDPSPIQVEVRRHVEWGRPMRPAGLGVMFLAMSDFQRREIHTWIG